MTKRTHPVGLIFDVGENQIIVLLETRAAVLALTDEITVDALEHREAVSVFVHMWLFAGLVLGFS